MEDLSNKLKINPLNYVESLESPIGVYLRRGIFKEEDKDDETLKRRFYEKMVDDQSADGS